MLRVHTVYNLQLHWYLPSMSLSLVVLWTNHRPIWRVKKWNELHLFFSPSKHLAAGLLSARDCWVFLSSREARLKTSTQISLQRLLVAFAANTATHSNFKQLSLRLMRKGCILFFQIHRPPPTLKCISFSLFSNPAPLSLHPFTIELWSAGTKIKC